MLCVTPGMGARALQELPEVALATLPRFAALMLAESGSAPVLGFTPCPPAASLPKAEVGRPRDLRQSAELSPRLPVLISRRQPHHLLPQSPGGSLKARAPARASLPPSLPGRARATPLPFLLRSFGCGQPSPCALSSLRSSAQRFRPPLRGRLCVFIGYRGVLRYIPRGG